MGIVKRKSLAAAEKTRHHERLSISIDEKEQDAKEHYQQEKEEEEEGDASDLEEPWDGMVEDGVLPPVSIWFGVVVRLSNTLILQVEPGFGGVITATTNGVVGSTPRL